MSPTPMDRAAEMNLGLDEIPKQRYVCPEFAAREWGAMWSRVWLLAGLESDLAQAGEYFTFEIGSESILVVRLPDGSIGARYNVCMHRGNRLREPGRGRAGKFSCVYHGWQYGLDGTLLKATDAESFPQGLPTEKLSLRTVRCECWGGFVWINLDPNASALRDYLGVIPEHLEPYGFENWKLDSDMTIEVECNWKTSVDAFNEAYHVHATHPATLEFTDDVGTVYDCYARHTRMIFPEVIASPRHPGHGTVTAGIKENFLARVGVDVSSFRGGVADARSAFGNAIRSMGSGLGADFSQLNESQMCDDFHYTIFPNITLNIHSMFVWVFRHRPHPSDPNKMYFDFWNLLNTPNQDVKRPRHEARSAVKGGDLSHIPGGEILEEDMYNLPRIQSGMQSDAFESLHLGIQEVRIRHFHRVLMSYLDGGDGSF